MDEVLLYSGVRSWLDKMVELTNTTPELDLDGQKVIAINHYEGGFGNKMVHISYENGIIIDKIAKALEEDVWVQKNRHAVIYKGVIFYQLVD